MAAITNLALARISATALVFKAVSWFLLLFNINAFDMSVEKLIYAAVGLATISVVVLLIVTLVQCLTKCAPLVSLIGLGLVIALTLAELGLIIAITVKVNDKGKEKSTDDQKVYILAVRFESAIILAECLTLVTVILLLVMTIFCSPKDDDYNHKDLESKYPVYGHTAKERSPRRDSSRHSQSDRRHESSAPYPNDRRPQPSAPYPSDRTDSRRRSSSYRHHSQSDRHSEPSERHSRRSRHDDKSRSKSYSRSAKHSYSEKPRDAHKKRQNSVSFKQRLSSAFKRGKKKNKQEDRFRNTL